MKNLKFLLLLLSLCSLQGQAQDWLTDMKKMNQVYSEASSFSMDISVKMYEKIASISPIATYQGHMASAGTNYYSDFMGKTTIFSDQSNMIIDNNQKVILYKSMKGQVASSLPEKAIPVVPDSLIYKNANGKYVINTAKEKRIQIIAKNSGYSKIEISIDPSTFTLRQIIFYKAGQSASSGETEKTVIDYTNVTLNTDVSVVFSDHKYVKVKNSKVELTKAFSSYRLINQGFPKKR